MLNKVRIILVSALFVVASSMSYLSYHLIGEVGKLRERNNELVVKLAERREDIRRLETSCKIDSNVSFETIEQAQKMADKIPEIMQKLDSIEIKQQEVPANDRTQDEKASEDRAADRADNELMQLLDEAYCTAARDSSYCTSR